MFYRLGSATRQDGIIETVIDCLPQRLCRSVAVSSEGEPIDPRVVQAVISAIRQTWIAARRVGTGSIFWDGDDLIVRYGRSGSIGGEVQQIYKMYGYQEFPQRHYGETIVTRELHEAVCSYRFVMQYLQGRIKHSYAQMMVMAGELSVDLADDVRAKIDEEFQKTRSIQAPEGSALIGTQVALTDIHQVMKPFRERIAHEAGLPIWLVFPDEAVGTAFELANRADYLFTEFDRWVKPAIVGVFQLRDLDVSVETPSFRDAMFDAEVQNQRADAEYKRSATDQNDNAVRLANEQFQLQLEQMQSGSLATDTKTAQVPEVPKPRKGRRR
jgi:hypothetical protein